MFKRYAAVRITGYILTWIVITLAWCVLVGFATVWLIPDQSVRLVVSFFLGFVPGFILTPILLDRYLSKY
jgi:hypothetical protein